jgi:arylsulfatase
MDLFPTFARIAGGRAPDDRVIDGVDQTDFFVGRQEKSNREGVIIYMGDDIYGVKWRDWKLTFKEQDTAFTGTVSYSTMRVYNILTDPGERESVLFPNTWVPKAALVQLEEHIASLEANPPIKPGTLAPYVPASK